MHRATDRSTHGSELGVRPAEGPPRAYGCPHAEVEAARHGAAALDARGAGLVRVRGREAAGFLQRLLAGEVARLGPGEGGPNLLLDAKGRVRFAFELERDADELRLSTAPGAAPALLAALEAYHFSEALTLEDATAEHAPLELLGPRAEDVLTELLGCAPELPPRAWLTRDWTPAGGGARLVLRVSRIERFGAAAWRLDAGPLASELWSALEAAGATPIGRDALDALRVSALDPGAALALGLEVYPQEVGLEGAFSLSKGCYVGQEVVAKLDTYGGLKRRLLRVALDAAGTLEPPLPLETPDGDEAGVLVLWSGPPASPEPCALALVKLRFADAADLRVGAVGARLVAPA